MTAVHARFAQPATPRLTRRELEVLYLTAEGLTSKEIARELGISPRTADVHRTNVLRKMGLRNRVEAVRYALTTGILAVDRSQLAAPYLVPEAAMGSA